MSKMYRLSETANLRVIPLKEFVNRTMAYPRRWRIVKRLAEMILEHEGLKDKCTVHLKHVVATYFKHDKFPWEIQFGVVERPNARIYVVNNGRVYAMTANDVPEVGHRLSVLIEEVAHAVAFNQGYKGKHGDYFFEMYKYLWAKYAKWALEALQL